MPREARATMEIVAGYESPGYDCCCCWGCYCIGFGDNAKYIPIHDAAHATMVITATYKNKMIERKRPALPLSPQRHVMFRGAYYIGGPAVPSEVLDAIAADAAFTKDVIECTCTQPVACCGKPFYAAPATVPDADALEKLRGRYPYLAFEAEPRWVSHNDNLGPCGMVSQWATVLTISANPAVPKLDPNSRAAREAALRAELAEDRD